MDSSYLAHSLKLFRAYVCAFNAGEQIARSLGMRGRAQGKDEQSDADGEEHGQPGALSLPSRRFKGFSRLWASAPIHANQEKLISIGGIHHRVLDAIGELGAAEACSLDECIAELV